MAEAEGSTARRTRYVATACEACKTAKKKCDGNQPCQNCIDHGRDCIIDESRDRRRGRKRTWDDLQAKAGALDTILDSLRASDDSSVQGLLHLIRNDASIDDVTEHARKLLQREQLRNRSQDRTRRNVMRIATLTDDPPIRVPARPWTDVTDDDDFVSHLMSVFFVWHWPAYPTVDQELFVAAMNARDLSTRFCSPVLVNAMLAVACNYSDHPSVFDDPSDQHTRGQHFLDEAKRRWNNEEGKLSLTNLQAISSLIAGNIIVAKDQVSFLYVTQSMSIRTELERRVRVSMRQGTGDYASSEFQRSLGLAVWGAFMCEVETAIAFMRPTEFRIPRVARPWTRDDLETRAYWRPYPKPGPEISFSPKGTLDERMNLYEIACHIPNLLLAGPARGTPPSEASTAAKLDRQARLQSVESQLREWRLDLPTYARHDSDGLYPVAPPVIDTLLAFHTYQITVQEALVHEEELGDIRGDGTDLTRTQRHAEDEIIFASTNIANIFRNYQRTIGLTNFPMYTFQACMKSASALLNMLHRPTVPDVFHQLIVALAAASRRWIIAHGAIKVMWVTIKERQLDGPLLEATKELFHSVAVENWGSDTHLLFERCSYPNYAAFEKGRLDVEEMGELLEKAARLNLDC